MKKIEFTNHEKMLVELCLRSILCDLLNGEKEAIWSFTATLFNMNNRSFGDQEHYIEDTNDWFSQIPILRQALLKLQTEEQAKLDAEFGSQPFVLPEETDLVLRKKIIEETLADSPYIKVKLPEN
jgi:hypothetical protein